MRARDALVRGAGVRALVRVRRAAATDGRRAPADVERATRSRITSGPTRRRTRARTSTTSIRSSTGRRGSRSRTAKGSSSRQANDATGRSEDVGRLRRTGRRSGTYHAKLNFVVAGQWAVGDSVSARFDHPLERIDWMQEVLTTNEPSNPSSLMRHFYRSHMSPADVLAVGGHVLPGDRPRAEHDRAAHAHVSGPLGALKLSVAAEGGHYTFVAGRDRPDGREPPRPQREEILRDAAPHRRSDARARARTTDGSTGTAT